MTRQNYYARRRERQRKTIDAELVVLLVQQERRQQPRLGGRKLLRLVRPELVQQGVAIGRDRFFDVLKEQGLLVEHKPGRPKTTKWNPSLPVRHNLIAGEASTAPNQVWVSDLTYIRTQEGYLYAALITDRFSRKIVGHFVGDTLEAQGCLNALEKALACLPIGFFPIHHSDRGCQYCSRPYIERLEVAGLRISMTEQFHCYENAMAERVNGILKQEYELDCDFRTKVQARTAFDQAVWLYNNRRPHMGLNYRIPGDVHQLAA